MRWARMLIGAYRHYVWGWCPACNSDAPERDVCPVCRAGYGEPGYTEDGADIRWVRFAERGYR